MFVRFFELTDPLYLTVYRKAWTEKEMSCIGLTYPLYLRVYRKAWSKKEMFSFMKKTRIPMKFLAFTPSICYHSLQETYGRKV